VNHHKFNNAVRRIVSGAVLAALLSPAVLPGQAIAANLNRPHPMPPQSTRSSTQAVYWFSLNCYPTSTHGTLPEIGAILASLGKSTNQPGVVTVTIGQQDAFTSTQWIDLVAATCNSTPPQWRR
jgi:hypothetical protein